MAEQIKPSKTEITLPPVEVGIDFSKLSDEQLGVAEKIIAEAEAQGLDPELALSIAHIENRFTQGRNSPKGAIGVMQLMPGTAEMLKVDPNNIDQNIKGGISYYKQMLDKYQDPNIAAIAYNAGPGVADKFLQSDDPSVIPTETLDYVEKLNNLYSPGMTQDAMVEAEDDGIPEIVDFEAEKTPGQYNPDKLGLTIGAGAGTGAGIAFGSYSDKAIARAEKAEAASRRPVEAAAKKVASIEGRINTKGPEQTNRVKIQSAISDDAAKEASRLSKEALNAEKRLIKAADNARRFGVLEETVKTLPGGVTQEGGIGSGAMRHSNVMGEITEANTVRKGTTAAGPGYAQKSRLIVPDKYANVELYNPEQKTALAKYEAAQKEHARLLKSAEKAEAAAQKQAERLRNVAVRGPTGLSVAEEQLEAAKQVYADAVRGAKEPGRFTKAIRNISKIPGAFALPGAFAGLDAADAAERYKQGDITGAIISGTGALGGALSMVPPVNPLFAGARVLGSGLSLAAPAVQYMRDSFNTEEEPAKFGIGGAVTAIINKLAKKEAVKASEALGKHEGKTLMTTQADRTKVGEGFLGGPGFSGLQLENPAYGDVGAAWAVGNAPTASTIIGANRRVPPGQAIWLPMIGSPTQHKSNTMVFNQIMKEFKSATKKGKLDPDLRDAINLRIASTVDAKTGEPIFDLSKPIDILSPKFQKQLNTFDKRAAVADILGGKGVGGKKGSIIDFDRIIQDTTDPDLIDAPTGSLGSRLFTLSGEKLERPDLHPAFPHILTGEDLGVHFPAAPREIILGDYLKNFRETKGREPGYMDLTRGHAPSQLITEEMLTNLQKAGYKKGGLHTEETGNVSRPASLEGLDYNAPIRALQSLSGIAGTGLGYLKEGLNMIRPAQDQNMIGIGGGFGLGDLIPGEEALKRYSKAGQGPFTGGEYFVNPVTGEGAVSPIEPDVMGMADVAGLYGLGLTKPVTAPIKMLLEKYGPVMASKTARPYAMVEATSPELLQDTYRMRGTGEMAGDPAGLALTDERARVALERAGLSKYDVQPGQGAWGGGGESEFNRGYSIKLPRGDMKKAEGALAQFGSDTDQMMMSAVKFVPQKSFAKSTAIEVKGVTEKDIVELNKTLGDKFVLQHRPQTKSVVVFNWETPGKNMSDLQDTVSSVIPKGRVTPGTYDSTVLDSSQYASKGAKPKGQKTIETEQKIINRKR